MNYRLEFNEEQQRFHLDNYSKKENTCGWFTVIDGCSDLEYWQFLSLLEAMYKKPYTRREIMHSLQVFYGLLANLTTHRMTIMPYEELPSHTGQINKR